MNLDELCQLLKKSPSTLMTNFVRTQQNLLKKGIVITKIGVGQKAEYYIEYKKEKNKNV